MVVKDILRYKQKGDRTEHWVKERNNSKKVDYSSTLTFTTPNWMMGSGSSVSTVSSGTATQIQALQSQQMQQAQFQPGQAVFYNHY